MCSFKGFARRQLEKRCHCVGNFGIQDFRTVQGNNYDLVVEQIIALQDECW